MSYYSNYLLLGHTALVTGAGKGIGRACAIALARYGAKVLAVARTQSDLDALVQESANITTIVADATSPSFLEKLSYYPMIDILVNNLGTNIPEPFLHVSEDNLDKMLDLNIRAVFKITQHIANQMVQNKHQGSIINISSQMGHVGSPNRSVYCMTKHAVEGLTKALAVELAADNIRVNSVAPTFIETPMTKPMLENPDFRSFVMANIPLAKLAKDEDVANAVVFLASSELSSMVTGSSIKVDGGWTAH